MRIIMLLVCTAVLTSCAWIKGETKAAVADTVDCSTAKAKAAITAHAPAYEMVVVDSIDAAGHADWNRIRTAASGLTTPSLSDAERALGGCVMQAVINRLLDPVRRAGAVQSAEAVVDRGELAAGWDALRADAFGGRTFARAQ